MPGNCVGAAEDKLVHQLSDAIADVSSVSPSSERKRFEG